MSLSERLANAVPAEVGGCRTCLWYAKLSPEDQATFDEWAQRKDVARLWFLSQCVEEGLDITETSFRRHFRNCRRESH